MDPETLREAIPALENGRYLNTGASGPSPRQVVERAADCERAHQYESPTEEGMYEFADTVRTDARDAVADLLNATPEEVALTESTVDGINHVSTAIDWNPEDVVVRTDLEHPAGELPWERMRQRHGIEIREIPTEQGRIDLDAVKEAVTDARLICLSSLSWNYGTRLPVAEITEIAHDAGAQVLVDAVQSPGQHPVDVTDWNADFVAASGHKWLLGLWGAGFLYIDKACMTQLDPLRVGYFSIDKDADTGPETPYQLHSDARRFELGTAPVSQFGALETAIDLLAEIGYDTIEARIGQLTDRLKDGLGDRLLSPHNSQSGLVTFAADEPEQLVERLAEKDIYIRSLPEPAACRASLHVFNTIEDVDQLLAALDDA